jgi:hypothetical protein
MHRFYPKKFLSALLTKLLIAKDEGDYLLCQQCAKIKFSGYESMQRDIRQENCMNTLTKCSNLNKNFAIFVIPTGNIFLST